MDPKRLLHRMCQRHGVPFERVTHLVPLIDRALTSSNDARDRILRLVDKNLSLRVTTPSTAPPGAITKDLDGEVLLSVARVVHNWTPSKGSISLGADLPDILGDQLYGQGEPPASDE